MYKVDMYADTIILGYPGNRRQVRGKRCSTINIQSVYSAHLDMTTCTCSLTTGNSQPASDQPPPAPSCVPLLRTSSSPPLPSVAGPRALHAWEVRGGEEREGERQKVVGIAGIFSRDLIFAEAL